MRHWHPSKSQAREFASTMERIDAFCVTHGIVQSASSDSYYFTIRGQDYRVSNHSVERSFERSLGRYHSDGRKDDVIYIHASKTRIIEIYNDLVQGYRLDGMGRRIYV